MAIIDWNDPVSGDWSVATDWSTGKVPGPGDTVFISDLGSYTVTVSSAEFANSLVVNADQAALRENSGSLTIAGALHVDAGLVALNKPNTIGSITLAATGILAVGNGGALGTGTLTQSGGELLATATETLTNVLSLSGNSTIAAAHGTTLTEKASDYSVAGGSTLNFGAPGQDGTVLWAPPGGSITEPSPVINVQAGTLKGADNALNFLLGAPITVAAGATLDLVGNRPGVTDLTGGGSVIDSGAPTTLTLEAADFSGVISGPLSLEAKGDTVLSGANTYTGTTTIDSGVGFELGVDGTTGSIGGGAIVDRGTLYIFHDNAITLTNAISGAGKLQQFGTGVTSINTANTYTGGTTISAGTLAIGNGGALGTGTLTQSSGELLATANETLTNPLSFSGTSTIAAAHGKTLTEKATSFSVLGDSTLNFGAPGQDGTVIWDPTNGTITLPFPAINVQAGTLKGGSGDLTFLLHDSFIVVAAGATLDLAGNNAEFTLTGGGSVTDSGAAATLTLDAANFSGVISGPLSLEARSTVILGGNNTYSGATTIDAADAVVLGLGGATGSIGGGAIINAGTLYISRNNAITLTNAISGDGKLEQIGTGVTSINTADTYTGGTSIVAGTLAIGNGGALGTGTVTQTGGELLATANETLTNLLALSGTSTIAAAHGKTLTEKGDYNVLAGSTLNFGAPGQDGTIIWDAAGGNTTSPFPAINVRAGTLKGVGLSFPFLDDGPISVAAGATLDLTGNSPEFADLTGAGAVIDSDAAAILSLEAANFSGTISGALKLNFEGNATLSGLEDTTGGATLEGAITVTNAGTYDLVANTNITGSAGSSFVNNDIFEKTGGGVSAVSTDFVNNGALNVLSGSVQFTDGFTNHGVIHGRVTQSGGVTTVTALAPSDFNEDGVSDILWQNTTGSQAAVWEMNGNAKIGGGAVSVNPGPNWKAIGTGDFNGDGHSDVLWQNVDGQASIWEMDGNTKIGGGPVSPNPGPSWTAVGTGDFNGDGLSDILWQNANGQAAIWEMDGNTKIGGVAASVNPGPAWKAIGTGDFNDDGHSDILWQNAVGEVSIWEMDGDTRIGGGAASADPAPNWKVIGTGDFNDDGHSDILWQNVDGQVSIWEMNGITRIGGGALSVIPGPSLHAIGTGDFNRDGHSDILFQNTTSGQASIWEMNGTTLISSEAVSPNPGSGWRAVGS
jgi:fibronectin-binding autotransporter adhesin